MGASGSPGRQRRHRGRSRQNWTFAFVACFGFLILGRAVRMAGGPQLLTSASAALGFGLFAAFALRALRPQTRIEVLAAVGLAVSAALFGGWYFYLQ